MDGEETFVVEGQAAHDSSSSYFEEPALPLYLPPLQPAPVLRELLNFSPVEYVPSTKIDRLDDLNEPTVSQTEEAYGFKLNDTAERHASADRGITYNFERLRRGSKQPVLIVSEIPHYSSLAPTRANWTLSHPYLGWCNYCLHSVDGHSQGVGHGIIKEI